MPSLCTWRTCCAKATSDSEPAMSSISHIKSNLLRSAAGRLMFSCGLAIMLYRPYAGFAAASTAVRALSVVVIPAYGSKKRNVLTIIQTKIDNMAHLWLWWCAVAVHCRSACSPSSWCWLTFAILTVCCSMTSWIAVRSDSSILSNSSMQHIPWSASTSAPPSSIISPVTVSRWMDAVNPTPLLPRPVV